MLKVKIFATALHIIPISDQLNIDIDAQAVTPRWPPTPEPLLIDDGVYELVTVPLTSISLITNRTIKVHSFAPSSQQSTLTSIYVSRLMSTL